MDAVTVQLPSGSQPPTGTPTTQSRSPRSAQKKGKKKAARSTDPSPKATGSRAPSKGGHGHRVPSAGTHGARERSASAQSHPGLESAPLKYQGLLYVPGMTTTTSAAPGTQPSRPSVPKLSQATMSAPPCPTVSADPSIPPPPPRGRAAGDIGVGGDSGLLGDRQGPHRRGLPRRAVPVLNLPAERCKCWGDGSRETKAAQGVLPPTSQDKTSLPPRESPSLQSETCWRSQPRRPGKAPPKELFNPSAPRPLESPRALVKYVASRSATRISRVTIGG